MNRSEELAKLLGIEPKNACLWISNGIKTCMSGGYKCTKEKCNNGYPNFTNPDNFVKLLKLKDQNNKTLYEQYIYIYRDTLENSVIDFLVTYLESNKLRDIDDYYRDDYHRAEYFKHQAQQTDWTY